MGDFTLKILLIWSISDFPGKRGFWVRSSPNMQPTDHMSTAVEYSCGEKSGHIGSLQQHKVDVLARFCVWVCLVCESGCVATGGWTSAFWLCKTHTALRGLVSFKPNDSQMPSTLVDTHSGEIKMMQQPLYLSKYITLIHCIKEILVLHQCSTETKTFYRLETVYQNKNKSLRWICMRHRLLCFSLNHKSD